MGYNSINFNNLYDNLHQYSKNKIHSSSTANGRKHSEELRVLYVALTRAREKCVVFTNFRAHDIHLTANPPFGVKSLQAFLEYAENLHYNQSVQYEDYDEAPFEDAICNFIAENGYEVDKKVGCAGFRVDLAIKDPDNPGKYILGIQCDGHNYASSKVARDRDRLREQVLNGLGWTIFRIRWSEYKKMRNRNTFVRCRKKIFSIKRQVQQRHCCHSR